MTPTEVQKIWIESKANGALYLGELLPTNKIDWPKGTWLENRIKEVRDGK